MGMTAFPLRPEDRCLSCLADGYGHLLLLLTFEFVPEGEIEVPAYLEAFREDGRYVRRG